MQILDVTPQTITGLVTVCGALTVVTIILAVIVAVNLKSIRALKRRYDSFMLSESTDGATIEQLIEECLYATNNLGSSYSVLKQRVSDIENKLPSCFQKIGVVRYNPFNDTGGDLSYAIALLDEYNTGFILNGIYSRSGSFTYAKEVENGVSAKHKLSPEEMEALQAAIRGQR